MSSAIVIVEDFPPVARGLARQVRGLIPDARVSLYGDMAAAREHIQNRKMDVLLLDLNLRGHDGFELLGDCVSRAFHTIVVSANTDRALEAFEYGVLDFVPKPVTRERLRQAFDRLAGATPPEQPAPRYFAVRGHGRVQMIDIALVDYIKGAGKYTELILMDDREVLHDKSLNTLSTLLTPSFYRIHKSYLVPLAHIAKLEVLGGGRYRARLHSGTTLPVGRSRYRELADRFL